MVVKTKCEFHYYSSHDVVQPSSIHFQDNHLSA